MTAEPIEVLIVDDEPPIRILLRDYLEDMDGVSVRTAGSGEEALALLRQGKAMICVVDMRLPGMDGNEFIKRSSEECPGCQFIIHSGTVDYLVPASLAAVNIDWECYFHKPADMEKIAQCILKLAANRDQGQSLLTLTP